MPRQYNEVAERIVAVHILPTLMREPDAYNGDPYQPFVELFKMRWRQLGLLLKKLCKTSANADFPALKRFQLDGYTFSDLYWYGWYNWWPDAEFWELLKDSLPAAVKDLVLMLPTVQTDFEPAVLLQVEWPHLRTFTLMVDHSTLNVVIPGIEVAEDDRWNMRINRFLTQHLENIEVTNNFPESLGLQISIPHTFSKLKRCALNVTTND
ncbi:hypothetical protein A4X13_0g8150 [Tilletia indica]|uniref:Uncharacterized protein n=1 Tax=Tilletia indica TaxID=43049 RepID=A0A177T2K9_9BASI|nr:hypothetical protein A4X13_0g8150 [Tilletia indica]